MKAHNEGKNGAKYTRTKRPVTLVYYEGFSTKEEAMRREYEIKQFTRNKKLELLSF
jgi:putative endonuclease